MQSSWRSARSSRTAHFLALFLAHSRAAKKENPHNILEVAEQLEINEIIMRDINRTFPEHPFFGSSGGQTSLFRLLKAYSLQDIEVGYCQVR